MSEELFFRNDEDDDEVIEGWLKEAGGDVKTEDIGQAEVRLGNDARNKFGLGFENSTQKGSVALKKEENDALMERIKKRKRQAKEDRKNANKYQEEHGVVEEELEGKAAVASKSSKFQKQNSHEKNLSGKTKASTKKSVEKPEGSSSVQDSTKVGTSTSNKESNVRNNSNNDNKTEKGESFVKRKRPKTRSKQKNIRRDKRDASFMPAHLRWGSESYAGRPLSEETKKHMGIAK